MSNPTRESTLVGIKKVIDEIHLERQRQLDVEGFTSESDDRYNGDLAIAGAAYAFHAGLNDGMASPPSWWPWSNKWWKPKSRRQDLIRAAALIAAEIERLDRIAN